MLDCMQKKCACKPEQMVTIQQPYSETSVTAQIALDLFESKENTRSVPYVIKLDSSMFDAEPRVASLAQAHHRHSFGHNSPSYGANQG